jgi:hypothetical protein
MRERRPNGLADGAGDGKRIAGRADGERSAENPALRRREIRLRPNRALRTAQSDVGDDADDSGLRRIAPLDHDDRAERLAVTEVP